MQALGMTDGFFTVLLMGGCKAVRFLLDSKNCLLLSGYGGMQTREFQVLVPRGVPAHIRVSRPWSFAGSRPENKPEPGINKN